MTTATRLFDEELLRIGNDAVVVHRIEDGAVIDFNEQALDLFEIAFEDARALALEALCEDQPPCDVQALRQHLDQVRRTGSHRFAWRKRVPSRRELHLDVTLRALTVGGRPRIVSVMRDVTDAREAERELGATRAFLDSALHQSPAGIAVFGGQPLHLTVLNPSARRALGVPLDGTIPVPDEVAASWTLLRPDGVPFERGADPIDRVIEGREVVRNESCGIRLRDGTTRWVLVNAAPVLDGEQQMLGGVVVFSDVTDERAAEQRRRELERQLFHNQRLEAVNALALGVAHEINNPLMGIVSRAELLTLDSEDPEACRTHGEAIVSLCERMGAVVRDLVAFARPDPAAFAMTDVLALVTSVLSTLRPQLRRDRIEARLDAPPTLPLVACKPGEIQQLVVNLVQNAQQAMAARAEGERLLIVAGESPEPGWVRYSVSDTGIGMTRDVASRAFDPFFSTHPAGEGRGLGLAASQTIIEGHRGRLWLESTPGKGTTVTFELPIDPGAIAVDPARRTT